MNHPRPKRPSHLPADPSRMPPSPALAPRASLSQQEFRRMPSDLNISPHMWDGGGVLRVARISVWEMYSEWTRAMSVVGEMCSFVQ